MIIVAAGEDLAALARRVATCRRRLQVLHTLAWDIFEAPKEAWRRNRDGFRYVYGFICRASGLRFVYHSARKEKGDTLKALHAAKPELLESHKKGIGHTALHWSADVQLPPPLSVCVIQAGGCGCIPHTGPAQRSAVATRTASRVKLVRDLGMVWDKIMERINIGKD